MPDQPSNRDIRQTGDQCVVRPYLRYGCGDIPRQQVDNYRRLFPDRANPDLSTRGYRWDGGYRISNEVA
jgi:hypothetical protein